MQDVKVRLLRPDVEMLGEGWPLTVHDEDGQQVLLYMDTTAVRARAGAEAAQSDGIPVIALTADNLHRLVHGEAVFTGDDRGCGYELQIMDPNELLDTLAQANRILSGQAVVVPGVDRDRVRELTATLRRPA